MLVLVNTDGARLRLRESGVKWREKLKGKEEDGGLICGLNCINLSAHLEYTSLKQL